MKKTVLATAALTVLMGSATVFAQAQSTGEIQFSGEVTSATCTMNPIDTVNLGSISTRTLTGVGTYGGWGHTTIQFTDCELGGDLSSIELTVGAGVSANGNTDLWENTYGQAEKVGIEVKIDGQAVPPAGTTAPIIATISGSTVEYRVSGRMAALGQATEGAVGTTLNIVASYK